MSLTTRLTVFFLTSLAVLLAGFGVSLYLLVRSHLYGQLEDRLQGTLNLLIAGVEDHESGLEWEGFQGREPPDDQFVCWIVQGEHDSILSQSRTGKELLQTARPGQPLIDAEGQRWQTIHRQLKMKGKPPANGHFPTPVLHRSLAMTVATPLGPTQSALRQLAMWISSFSLGLWLLAAVASRWLCRRALMPVRNMAAAARAMHAADRAQRLPVAATGDELQELGQSFNDLLTRLHESFERQARFTGDASHQLRTPLTALLGQIEIALRHPREAQEYARVLSVLHEQAEQLRQIVDSLLFLARADAEAKSPRLETMNLREWLKERFQSWSGHVRAADLRLQTSAAGDFTVRSHAPLLRQLLDNLLDNACKYSAVGSPITVSLDVEDSCVCLSVADVGCGIAAEDVPHLFEPFYRSIQARRQGVAGLGLGLAVAYRIAQALGGTLSVQSQPEQGSRFTLRLRAGGA